MSVGYAVSNVLTGLAATAFTWSSGYTTGRNRLNDGEHDELASGSSSAQASGQYLQVDLGSAQALVGVAVLNHNLGTGACTVKVEGADDAAMSINLVTAKAASTINTSAPNQKDTVLQFPSVTKRYWRLTFTHSGTKTLTIGELFFLSSITALTRNIIYGYGESERYINNGTLSKTGRTRSTYLGGPIRTKRFAFKDLRGASERDELLNMWRATQGGNKRLLWLDSIESTATAATSDGMACLWGRLAESLGWTGPDFNLFDVDGFELIGEGREVGS